MFVTYVIIYTSVVGLLLAGSFKALQLMWLLCPDFRSPLHLVDNA